MDNFDDCNCGESRCSECFPPLTRKPAASAEGDGWIALLQQYRAQHKECKDLTGHPDALKSQAKDWRCDLCRQADPYLQPLPAPPSGQGEVK